MRSPPYGLGGSLAGRASERERAVRLGPRGIYGLLSGAVLGIVPGAARITGSMLSALCEEPALLTKAVAQFEQQHAKM